MIFKIVLEKGVRKTRVLDKLRELPYKYCVLDEVRASNLRVFIVHIEYTGDITELTGKLSVMCKHVAKSVASHIDYCIYLESSASKSDVLEGVRDVMQQNKLVAKVEPYIRGGSFAYSLKVRLNDCFDYLLLDTVIKEGVDCVRGVEKVEML